MRVKFFVIPALDPLDGEAELNRFLNQHRVLKLDRELVTERMGTFWAVSVSYQEAASTLPQGSKSKRRVDYKELLSPPEFEAYAALRQLRKEIAEREAVPPYAIFNNAQLAEMVQMRARTAEELGRISGVGPSRIESYAPSFLHRLEELQEGEYATGEE